MGRIIRDIGNKMANLFSIGESARRSRCGMGVEFWDEKRNFGGLGIIESSAPPQAKLPDTYVHAAYLRDFGAVSTAACVFAAQSLPDAVLGDIELDRSQSFEMLRRSKLYLAMRKPDQELIERLERRRDWNIANRPIENNLDLYPSVKYSYSSAMPSNKGRIDLVVSEKGNARFSGVAHSNNMRLDPVDAQKISYKRRLEIQRALQWGYDNGFIPVMMTLTIFHDWTWDALIKLIAVLRKSYGDLFGHKIGEKLKKAIGFQYRIFRMEETLDEKNGWHPHYHIVLFVPKDNLKILSDLESRLKERWCRLVQKYYCEFLGKDIPDYGKKALYEHGLMLSRYSKDVKDKRNRVIHKQGELYQVDDSKYLAKIMGCDSDDMYGGDVELSATLQKDTMIPFDLLRGEPTAEKVDLWNEYALATKGLSCFRFTLGFKAVIDEYFEQHPDRDPVAMKSAQETVVATLKEEVYHLLYRNFKLKELKQKVAEGYDALRDWLRELFIGWGLSSWCENPYSLPRPPT